MSSSPDPNPTLPEPSIHTQNDAESQPQSDKNDAESQPQSDNNEENPEEEEEEGECGFCLFMKGGGCKEAFTSWELCIEEGEKNNEDIVDKCFDVTSALKKCMEAHSDYYEPILRAEKAAEAEVAKELQAEREKTNEEGAIEKTDAV